MKLDFKIKLKYNLNYMNVLELFCGTKSVGKVCDKLGWSSVSVDLEKKFKPTHLCNIMDFDYKQYDKNYFDIIWASPPCTDYSQLKKCWYGRKVKKYDVLYSKELHEKEMDESDNLIKKTLEIIDYFNVKYWFLENPLSTLKDREVLKHKDYYLVDYCMYSDWGYKKRTCIWTNKKNWNNKLCDNNCGNMMDINGQKLHRERMGTSKTINDNGKIIRCNTKELRIKYKDFENLQKYGLHGTTLEQRYRIPEKLIFSLFND
jgi:hypothetical protein